MMADDAALKQKHLLPLLSPAASRRKVSQMETTINSAIQNNAAIPKTRTPQLNAHIKSVAHRYAMMVMVDVNRDHPIWPTPKRSEQTIKRQIERFHHHCGQLLKKVSEANVRQLTAAAEHMCPEAGRALPGVVFCLPALRAGSISRDQLCALFLSATEARKAASELFGDARPHAGSGRPRNVGASAIALMLARDFFMLTGKEPKFGGNHKNGEGPFEALVSDVFAALGVKASASTESRKAVTLRKERQASQADS